MSEYFAALRLGVDACYDFHRWDSEKGLFVPLVESEKRAVLREASPLLHVTDGDPPTLLFHGDQDAMVPIQQSQVFARRMEEAGANCKLIIAEGQGHGWVAPLPGEIGEIADWFERHLLRESSPNVLEVQQAPHF